MEEPDTILIVLSAHLPFARSGSLPPVRYIHGFGWSEDPEALALALDEDSEAEDLGSDPGHVRGSNLKSGTGALDPGSDPFLYGGLFHPDFAFSRVPPDGHPEIWPIGNLRPAPWDSALTMEEQWFFEALSCTYLPLLELFDRLEKDRVPFRLSISFSPLLCYMLQDRYLLGRYLSYVDRQIEFGSREMERTRNDPELHRLARSYYDQAVDRRILFTGRYGGNPLWVFDYYQRKGRVEILATAATHAFLPAYIDCPEAIRAQLETAILSFRRTFGRVPQGFWLPELGWVPDLDGFLRAYGFVYTIADTHAGLMGSPKTSKGSFYPVRTPAQTLVIFRDFHACRNIQDMETGFRLSPDYLDFDADAGFELPADMAGLFLDSERGRIKTGCAYYTNGGRGREKRVYDPDLAAALAREQALSFLTARSSVLRKAGNLGGPGAVSLCAWDADFLGRFWREGTCFLEALFREAPGRNLRFLTPGEYFSRQNSRGIARIMPEFSSWGFNGYAESWIDASNDWIYPHVMSALDRMLELAERFPNDVGIKERALNQAAREILLVQASDWPRMLYKHEYSAYAREQVETTLRNFTTIYEALGSNHIDMEWLTTLERRHSFFPDINYRVFRSNR
ncbi:MAG: DUF1957 domain-containing protein [Treponema sp.]|jgi:1,4-alpha-glucan branching enzyme|nr:DUF1957 domain-containing protein [Treponema sp.]